MMVPYLTSIMPIERQFSTGDMPVLVSCSDMNTYICKYARLRGKAFRLGTELTGGLFSLLWGINSPNCVLVNIKPEHWDIKYSGYRSSAPAVGYYFLKDVIDVNSSSFMTINRSKTTLYQLLQIALFDFWVANEDRTYNNPNMLYCISEGKLVSIDYGGILNTSSYDYEMSQLTSTDTILYADIFKYLSSGYERQTICDLRDNAIVNGREAIKSCHKNLPVLLNNIPPEWELDNKFIYDKLMQLFDSKWIDGCIDNFIDCINDNLEN